MAFLSSFCWNLGGSHYQDPELVGMVRSIVRLHAKCGQQVRFYRLLLSSIPFLVDELCSASFFKSSPALWFRTRRSLICPRHFLVVCSQHLDLNTGVFWIGKDVGTHTVMVLFYTASMERGHVYVIMIGRTYKKFEMPRIEHKKMWRCNWCLLIALHWIPCSESTEWNQVFAWMESSLCMGGRWSLWRW